MLPVREVPILAGHYLFTGWYFEPCIKRLHVQYIWNIYLSESVFFLAAGWSNNGRVRTLLLDAWITCSAFSYLFNLYMSFFWQNFGHNSDFLQDYLQRQFFCATLHENLMPCNMQNGKIFCIGQLRQHLTSFWSEINACNKFWQRLAQKNHYSKWSHVIPP